MYRPQLTCVLLVHITSTHRPGSDTTVGKRCVENKKIICTRKIYPWRCIATRGESVSTYPRRPKAEALAQHGRCSRTPSRSDRSSTERTTPPSSVHVQLDDVPRTPIQPSVEGEFRQHDGVVTILMYYHRRASPKHRYNIIEDYGGRGHCTRLRI